jgi:hypothetical protein
VGEEMSAAIRDLLEYIDALEEIVHEQASIITKKPLKELWEEYQNYLYGPPTGEPQMSFMGWIIHNDYA